MQRTITIVALIIYLLLTLTACVYHPPVQQGNIITDRELSALYKGMPKIKVLSLLGEPILVNIYADDRLVYVYTFQSGHKKMQLIHVIIYISNNRVTNFCIEK